MEQNKKITIDLPHLVVCEGADAKFFMIWFLRSQIKRDSQFEQFQAIDAGGIDQLPAFIKTLHLLPGFDIVKTLTIVRDAEVNARGAHQSIQNMLSNNGYAVPTSPCTIALPTAGIHNIKTGYALFPMLNAQETNGTLEDLCLNTLAASNKEVILGIADKAIWSYQEQVADFKRPHKNRLHTYLSLTDDFVGLKIGESARAKAFDFTMEVFEPLRSLLSEMLE